MSAGGILALMGFGAQDLFLMQSILEKISINCLGKVHTISPECSKDVQEFLKSTPHWKRCTCEKQLLKWLLITLFDAIPIKCGQDRNESQELSKDVVYNINLVISKINSKKKKNHIVSNYISRLRLQGPSV